MATTKKKAAPARTASAKKKAPAQPDAIALLKQDHEKVRGLLEQLEKSAGKNAAKAAKLVAQIEQELTVHATIEEEIFYPAFRDAVRSKDDKQMYYEALEEHHVVKLVMPEVREGQSDVGPEFAAKAKVLKELVEHHADEEEKDMFKKARQVMERDELRDLGDRMQQRKQQLMG
jgi:hemerythrin-like domain-containing protein